MVQPGGLETNGIAYIFAIQMRWFLIQRYQASSWTDSHGSSREWYGYHNISDFFQYIAWRNNLSLTRFHDPVSPN